MQGRSAAPDIMAKLKSHTVHRHDRVEALMPFFKSTFSLEEYACTLGMFLGFFEPLEQWLAAITRWQSVDVDLASRCRTYRLRIDLRALGFFDDDIGRIPRAKSLPTLPNVYHGLGCLYVLEGSTLGGQVIERELTRRFGIDATCGTSFFHSYAVDVGKTWEEFCTSVSTHVNDPMKAKAALISAEETFTSLESWIREVHDGAQ
jgi:heme oxygenase (biliverdin-IX-beta and delta-forming)